MALVAADGVDAVGLVAARVRLLGALVHVHAVHRRVRPLPERPEASGALAKVPEIAFRHVIIHGECQPVTAGNNALT